MREYPTGINCPNCGERCARHCPKFHRCGWFFCLAESTMHELGTFNPVTRKWKVQKTRKWAALR